MEATKSAYDMTKDEAAAELRNLGCEKLKREDFLGDTKTGWWMDDCYLGPTYDPNYALASLRGGG